MDSSKKDESGYIASTGELTANGVVLKKIKNFRIIEQAIEGDLPKYPIYLESEVNYKESIKDMYASVGGSAGIRVPVDVRQIDIPDAYKEMRLIITEELKTLIQELTKDFINKKGDN
jgi:hypothetical protein